jgi:hypothetical protein
VAAGEVAAAPGQGLTARAGRSRVSRLEQDSYGVSPLNLGDPLADRLCSRQSLDVIRGARTEQCTFSASEILL